MMTKYSGRATATIWVGALASSWMLMGLAALGAFTIARAIG